MINKNEVLSSICKDLMLKEPYYGTYLLRLNKYWDSSIKSEVEVGLSDSINFEMRVNADKWLLESDLHKLGHIKHELLHILYSHFTDFNDLVEKPIRDMAMDMEVNQYIAADCLPPQSFTINSIPGLNFKQFGGTIYYYNELIKTMQQNTPQGQAVRNAVQAMQNGETQAEGVKGDLPSHGDAWEKADNMDEATTKLIKAQTEAQMQAVEQEVLKSRGTVPQELQSMLERLKEVTVPKFNWKAYLRRFVGGSPEVYTKSKRSKPNHRFDDQPGIKIKQKQHVLIALDNSGSVSDAEIKEFFQELDHIAATGVAITLVQCDSAISSIEKYKRNQDIVLTSRGGTSFDPPIDYLNENQHKYTCMIYLTDGEAPAPQNIPSKRVLWVLSSKSGMTDHLPGYTIKLDI